MVLLTPHQSYTCIIISKTVDTDVFIMHCNRNNITSLITPFYLVFCYGLPFCDITKCCYFGDHVLCRCGIPCVTPSSLRIVNRSALGSLTLGLQCPAVKPHTKVTRLIDDL